MTDIEDTGQPVATEKMKCPHCESVFAPGYIDAHMRRKHNIWGGMSGRVRKQGKKTTGQALEVANSPKQSNPKFKILPFIVLEDQDGNMWLAERMER